MSRDVPPYDYRFLDSDREFKLDKRKLTGSFDVCFPPRQVINSGFTAMGLFNGLEYEQVGTHDNHSSPYPVIRNQFAFQPIQENNSFDVSVDGATRMQSDATERQGNRSAVMLIGCLLVSVLGLVMWAPEDGYKSHVEKYVSSTPTPAPTSWSWNSSTSKPTSTSKDTFPNAVPENTQGRTGKSGKQASHSKQSTHLASITGTLTSHVPQVTIPSGSFASVCQNHLYMYWNEDPDLRATIINSWQDDMPWCESLDICVSCSIIFGSIHQGAEKLALKNITMTDATDLPVTGVLPVKEVKLD